MTKKEGYISQEVARLAARAADEKNDKINANILEHEADKQHDQAMGKRVKIEAKLEKAKRDWELEIGLLMKMDGQKVEKLREVKKELVLLEKLILKLRQQVEQKDEAKMTREQNWDEYRQHFGD